MKPIVAYVALALLLSFVAGCPSNVVPDTTQIDTDADGINDTLDLCHATPPNSVVNADGCADSQLDSDGDGFTDDDEKHGTPGTDPFDPDDNPVTVRDSDQDGCSDFDELSVAESCDNDPNTKPDSDFDGIPDDDDNCVDLSNPDQIDSNGDGIGDVCAILFDIDDDGVLDEADNCKFIPNPDQADSNGDGIGDACTLVPDLDNDGVPDTEDNCLLIANPDQADVDNDGIGDACVPFIDFDGDGVEDFVDNCISTPNADQLDSDLDGLGDPCDPSPFPFVSGDVFSFLTPDETAFFLSLVASRNADIDRIVDDELSWVLADLFNRGFGSSSLVCNEVCRFEQSRARQKRNATAQTAIDAAASFGVTLGLGISELDEINDFNCEHYPNGPFVCDDAIGFPMTCVIDGLLCD